MMFFYEKKIRLVDLIFIISTIIGNMTRRERYEQVLRHFREAMPDAQTELRFGSVFQLLVAVCLSAQCTDKRVNLVTPQLFERFPDARAMAAVEADEVLRYISSVSYPNSKAEHLVKMSRMLEERFDGQVPESMDDLLSLPGVGRKTANVVRSVAFGRSATAVDTHVFRVSHRLGLAGARDNTPLKVEQQLVRNIPEEDIPRAHHWLILHGRYVCTARKPHCAECAFSGFCPSAGHCM